jgi:SAM-dependent methyltransferase
MTSLVSSDSVARSEGTPSVKARQQAMWASGDFAVIGTTLQIVGELLCEGVDLRSGERVLDVAAGNGNATLAAARRFASVTSTDYVPALLDRGRRRAEADGFDVTFTVADAEDLPYPAASFDVVLSTFGVMFAPDHERAAAEMMRVCKPGGRIGLASWTPTGFLGQLFRLIGGYVAPPPGVRSRSCGGPTRTSRRCSLARRGWSTRRGCSRSGIARRSTGSRCFGRTMGRSTRRSSRSMRIAGPRWKPISRRCFAR